MCDEMNAILDVGGETAESIRKFSKGNLRSWERVHKWLPGEGGIGIKVW